MITKSIKIIMITKYKFEYGFRKGYVTRQCLPMMLGT